VSGNEQAVSFSLLLRAVAIGVMNDPHAEWNKALAAVRGPMDQIPDAELRSNVTLLQRYLASGHNGLTKTALEAHQNELARRQKETHHRNEQNLQQEAISVAKEAHKETMKELGELKILVRRVPALRWIDWAILIAAVISAAAAVIAVGIVLFRKP